jgi:hypothetical protein
MKDSKIKMRAGLEHVGGKHRCDEDREWRKEKKNIKKKSGFFSEQSFFQLT